VIEPDPTGVTGDRRSDGPGTTAQSELARLRRCLDEGWITDEEYDQSSAEVLSTFWPLQ